MKSTAETIPSIGWPWLAVPFLAWPQAAFAAAGEPEMAGRFLQTGLSLLTVCALAVLTIRAAKPMLEQMQRRQVGELPPAGKEALAGKEAPAAPIAPDGLSLHSRTPLTESCELRVYRSDAGQFLIFSHRDSRLTYLSSIAVDGSADGNSPGDG